jgi:hypothetical protein
VEIKKKINTKYQNFINFNFLSFFSSIWPVFSEMQIYRSHKKITVHNDMVLWPRAADKNVIVNSFPNKTKLPHCVLNMLDVCIYVEIIINM